MKIPSLKDIQDRIRGQVVTENLVSQSGGSGKKLHNALALVPEVEMWRVVQWLHYTILPKIAQTRGVETEDYKNFTAARDAVIWSMFIAQQYEKVLMQRGQDRQLLGYYVQQNAFFENELLKYTTAENFFNADAARVFADGLVKKAVELLDTQKK